MSVIVRTVGLLIISNCFMTFAWYAHLRNLHDRKWYVAALLSWAIALFEYLFQVPANRIGYTQLSLSQLKIIQEVITLVGVRAVCHALHGNAVQARLRLGGHLPARRGLLHFQNVGTPTMPTRVRRAILPVMVLAACLAARPARTDAQTVTGLFANWADLETWTHYLESSKENELGLGLQVNGPGGTMLIAFLGRLDTREPLKPPADVGVQVAASERANPNTLRSSTLTFVLDDKGEHPGVLDFSASLLVDNPAPGAAANNGITHIPVKDFLRLASAVTLHATILGFDVDFRADQIRAMRALAAKLHLASPESGR